MNKWWCGHAVWGKTQCPGCISALTPLAKEKETAPSVEALYENQTPCNLYNSKCEERTSSVKAWDILPAKFHKQQRSWWGLQEGATVIAFKSTTLILSSCSSCTGVHMRIPRKAKAWLHKILELQKKLMCFSSTVVRYLQYHFILENGFHLACSIPSSVY